MEQLSLYNKLDNDIMIGVPTPTEVSQEIIVVSVFTNLVSSMAEQ